MFVICIVIQIYIFGPIFLFLYILAGLNEPTKEMDKDNAFLTAAKNGIMEIVLALKSKIPSVMHETNSNNENVLLVAVKNRQTKIVEELKNNLDKKLFDNLILEVDDMENTVLHLASGTTTHNERTWQIAGSAMQMMWDIKWYEVCMFSRS